MASLELLEKICPLRKRPPHYCWNIPKIQWKRPVYSDYFFPCDYGMQYIKFRDVLQPATY